MLQVRNSGNMGNVPVFITIEPVAVESTNLKKILKSDIVVKFTVEENSTTGNIFTTKTAQFFHTQADKHTHSKHDQNTFELVF